MATNQPAAEEISLETINQCSDISKLHDIYDNLLRYGNKSPNLTRVAREKLIDLHRLSKAAAALCPNEEKLVDDIVAAANQEFEALTETGLHGLMKKHVRELGFEQRCQNWVADVFEPNTKHDLTNEAIKIEHTIWLLSINMYLLRHTEGWNALSNAARDVAMWKMRNSMNVIRQESDAHTRSLPGGNIVTEMADGTTSSSWIPNQGEMATPGVTTALAYTHYATENEKGFIQKSAFVDGRFVEDPCHRMDRKGNSSMQTLDGTSIRHAVYHTAKEDGSPVAWDDIDVEQYSKKLAIMDKDSIILQKPTKDLKDGNGNTVSEEKQLRDQRIRYAEACKYEQVGSLKKEDLSEFKSLATFAFNVQVIEATTRQPAAVLAVGAQAKKTLREKGEKPFVTSLIRYYGWIYHPESMNRVCVTDLVRLRRSDGVMANFLSYLIGRSVVYYYAEFRCNKKFTEAEREAINAAIGQVGIQCAAIMKMIWNYRGSDSDYELKTRLEIFRELKSSLKDQFVGGAITACEKQLVLSEKADSIEEIVNDEYHRNEGNLTKRACFDAIKDDLLSSFNDKAKNVYSSRLAFEEERDDQKLISDMLARAKMKAKAAGDELDTDAFFEQLREKHPGKVSAIKFVAGREKRNSDVQMIDNELAKMKAKAAGTKFDMDAFFEQFREKHPDKADAIKFVAGREKSNKKRNSNVQTISEQLARAKKAAGTEFDTDEFFEELREKHPDKADAIKFVKHNSDVQTISNELAKMKAKAAGTEFDTDAFLEELREKHPDKGGAINLAAGWGKSDQVNKRPPKSFLARKKCALSATIASVEKAAKKGNIKECEIDCIKYLCVGCSETRSNEYKDYHFVISADLGKDKKQRVTCLLCQQREYIPSSFFRPRFRRVGTISFDDVKAERDKLEQQLNQEKKKKKPAKPKKKATKRMVVHATSPSSKKRKSSEEIDFGGTGDESWRKVSAVPNSTQVRVNQSIPQDSQSYETMFTGALEKHKLDVVKLLKESAAKGEKSVSADAMMEARKENVPVMRRANTFILKFGGKHRTEQEITAALIKAENDAVQLYITEARKKQDT